MAGCRRCSGRIQSHSLVLECSICCYKMHRECVPLTKEEFQNCIAAQNEWICTLCCGELFPFNHYDDNIIFDNVIEENNSGIVDISERYKDKIFTPFDLQEFENIQPLIDIDPELHFFNEVQSNILTNSEYYIEEKFVEKMCDVFNGRSTFSMYHANARSLPRHLREISNYLHCLQFQFSIIGFSETWLSPDNNEDLHGLAGYAHIGNHRCMRVGGGVSICV